MKNLLTLIFCIMLFGCSSVDPKTYSGQSPKMKLKEFFNGRIEGYGFFRGRSGEIYKRYYVAINASWEGNIGTVSEDFYLPDGSKLERKWTLKYVDENNFTGTAPDIVGEAKGKVEGYALNLKYTLAVERESGSTVNVNFDDWIYLQPDGSALNYSSGSKFGIDIGTIIFQFSKLKEGEEFKKSYFLDE